MTGEIKIYGLKRLYLDMEELGDICRSAIIVSTSKEPRRSYIDRFAHSLVLEYDDVIDPADSCAYTKEMAERVAAFVRECIASDGVESLYIACDYGESRSAGMGGAVIRYVGGEDLYLWDSPDYHPNPLVYSLTARALGIEVTDEDIGYLVGINQKRFNEAFE